MNRPQYVSVPEAFISSLAWKTFQIRTSASASAAAGRPLALMFKVKKSGSTVLDLRETAPSGEGLSAYGSGLLSAGLVSTVDDPSDLAQAVIDSVAGVQAEKSANQAASPVTPAFALLQNMRGVQRTKNPPDLAEILEAMYAHGLSGATESLGVAGRWLAAANQRCSIDPLLSALNEATMHELVGEGVEPADVRNLHVRGDRLRLPGTPFAWFAVAWQRLTSPEWVSALPARVWVDWATTVLRLALGQGFLWEAAWYDALARAVVGEKRFTLAEMLASVPDPLPWMSGRTSTAVSDVAPLLSWRVHRSALIRGHLSDWLQLQDDDLDFDVAIASMSEDRELKSNLVAALNSREKSAPNTWEAIRYSLMSRDATGSHADYYGLLRSHGRYLTVDPGTEWMAVVASLACEGPGKPTDVATLVKSLASLGLKPEVGDLIALLERAGLARGSADADQGVVVQSAF